MKRSTTLSSPSGVAGDYSLFLDAFRLLTLAQYSLHFDYDLRLAANTREDAERFCALSNALYSRKVTPAYYRWQFFDTPFSSRLAFLVSGNELVGCYGFQLRPAVTGCSIAWAIDIMIARDYQGQGLFRPLANYAEAKVQEFRPAALCVMANDRSVKPHVLGLGWELVKTIYTYELDLSAHAPPPSPIHGSSFDRLAAQRAAELAAKCPTQHWQTIRSGDFLEWRYASNPRYSYRLVTSTSPATSRAAVVTKLFHDPVLNTNIGDLVDVFLEPYAVAEVESALQAGIAELAASGATVVQTWLETNTAFDRIAARLGFRQTSQVRHFCRKHMSTDPAVMPATDWFLTMSDSEVY